MNRRTNKANLLLVITISFLLSAPLGLLSTGYGITN